MIDVSFMGRILPAFAQAAVVTAKVASLSVVLGLVMAVLVTSLRLSPYRLLRWIGTAYVSLMRGTPALIQLFLLYFGGPQVGINLEPMAAGVIGLGLNIAAYMAEAIRGALLSVDRGQAEAARTLGLSRGQTMRRVIVPQAARMMIRPLGVNAVALLKGTALVSTISVVELTFTAQRFIGSTYRAFEVFAVCSVFYMVMVYGVARVVDLLDKRYAIE